MIERKEFLEIINLLEKNYDKKIADEIIKIWYEEFKEFDAETFHHCVVECIKSEYFFPTINKVKEFEFKNRVYISDEGFTFKDGRRVL